MTILIWAKGDLACWTDIHGRERNALVEKVTASLIEIRVTSSLGDTLLHVDPRELSPR